MKSYVLLLTVLCAAGSLFAQAPKFDTYSPTSDEIRTSERIVTPNTATYYSVDEQSIRDYLHAAPDQANFLAGGINDYLLEVPDPTGGIARFKIVSYEMMEPGLSQKFPEIVNLLGIDVNQPTRKIRMDWTYTGMHASVVGDPLGAWYVEPLFKEQRNLYQVYYTNDYPNDPLREGRQCQFDDVQGLAPTNDSGPEKLLGDCIFRSYRLAVACTGEYYQFHGTTDAEVSSAINTTVARVNQVTEQDLAVRLILVANNDILLEDDPLTDGYTNDNANLLIEESHTSITAELGTANFDIGHTFSTGAGGLASLGAICLTSRKGKGVTGTNNPVGDPYDIDFVAHELGHQFGGNHSFNSTEGNCQARNSNTAYEPGSGTTIQAYAGICGATANVQQNSDPYYHIISLEEMENVIGNRNCEAVVAGVNNNPPVVDAGPDYTIPTGTPFVLTPASSSDPDGNTLTYTWEQYDLGIVEAGIPSGNTDGPLFRSLEPSSNSERVIDGSNTWETLPQIARTIQMDLTVRDINMTFGCTVSDFMTITVDNTGPFLVLSPNGGEEFGSGTTQNITWDVAGTGAGTDVDCADVDLEISLDGGVSYTTLLAGTPNDGTQSVNMPIVPISETQARIRIRCSDNIFYDFSDADFSIIRQEYTITAIEGESEVAICEGENEAIGFGFILESQAGYTGSVTYTAGGLPAGATATFDPVSPAVLAANGSQSVTLELGNTAALAVGTYPFRVNATDGNLMRFIELTLEVGAGGLTLNSPEDGSTVDIFDDNGTDKVSLAANIAFPAGTQSYSMVIEGIGTVSFGNITGPGNGNLTVTISFVNDQDQFTYYILAGNGDQTCPITVTAIDPALPVEWLDFTATARNNQSVLEWDVIQDGQGLSYTVEKRANNDRNFIEAMFLSDSRVSGPANYQVIDPDVRAGATYFYRIRQQDVDGTTSYSPIRSVTFDGRQESGAVLVPNPAGGSTTVVTGPFTTASEYVLFDALGRKVQAGNLTGSRTNIDLSNLPNAVYQVVLYGKDTREVMRLVKR